jgi:large subunit ribosomal protein L35
LIAAAGGGGVFHPKFPHKTLASHRAALCFRPLLMQKTKKSVAKRFKLTAKGKLVRRTPGFRHLLGSKSTKQKRRASRDKLVAEGHAEALKRALPFGL